MMNRFAISAFVGVVLVQVILATPPPRGVPTCVGEECKYQERVLGAEEKPVAEMTQKEQKVDALPVTTPKPPAQKVPTSSGKKKVIHKEGIETNLPAYYQNVDRSHYEASDQAVYVPKSSNPKLAGINLGDLLNAIVEQSIKASPSVPTPIRAILTSGNLKGAILIGDAKLDVELKRILLTFTKLRTETNQIYSIQASGLSLSGQMGVEGEYHSETGKFFLAELASASAAAIADSTIQRNQNFQGNWVQEPSLSNSAKQGAVTALSRTTDRIAEKVRTAPEWTEVPGYQSIKIIVTEEPKEQG